ncbi:hypothetical protein QBC45DRAFT_340491, partial [Copromyces sp. CBS 386.78]
IVIDFKIIFKDKKGYNNVLVIVNRFSKLFWCILYKDIVIGKKVAVLYYKGLYRILGFL